MPQNVLRSKQMFVSNRPTALFVTALTKEKLFKLLIFTAYIKRKKEETHDEDER